jgi:hypothetical protein
MTSTDYSHTMNDALGEYRALLKERASIDARLLRLRRFIYATADMLPEDQRGTYQAELAEMPSKMGSLTDSIREALRVAAQRNSSLTATEVRDHLKNAGFDFSQYASNPLASVSTILKRFKSSEVATGTLDGVTTYKWVVGLPVENSVVGKHRRMLELGDER